MTDVTLQFVLDKAAEAGKEVDKNSVAFTLGFLAGQKMASSKASPTTAEALFQGTKQGYGAMGLTAFYGPPQTNEQGIAVMRAAYDQGVRMFDTAQIYQQFGKPVPGTYVFNEELVGAFAKTVGRENVTLATKFYPGTEYSKEKLFQATDQSLARLGVDCIDLYYCHRMYPEEVVTIEAFMADMKELVVAGKVKHVGLSEASAATIRRAHAVHPVAVIQQEWSLFARDLEEEIVPTCQELGISIVAYSPIARGMLSGALTDPPKDWRASIPYLTEENIEANKVLVAKIKDMAAAKHATAAQICLAWVIHKGGIPIPGTTKVSHVQSNWGACDVVLTPSDMAALEELGNTVKGLRGDESYMKSTFHGQKK